MCNIAVAPLVGAWIEIPLFCALKKDRPSLLSWERGLKLTGQRQKGTVQTVAPLVGAWIEIYLFPYMGLAGAVAPLVGAWIEIVT